MGNKTETAPISWSLHFGGEIDNSQPNKHITSHELVIRKTKQVEGWGMNEEDCFRWRSLRRLLL